MEEVKFVRMPHDPSGRRIAYREMGCSQATAQRSLLAVHGLMSCRLSVIPGVSEDTLREYGVRVVAIDRPGYGRSDPHRRQSFYSTAMDLEAVMDALAMGDKVWLLGFSMGGAFCWAAARFIPHRIAGVALWSPVGNYRWKGITKQDRAVMQASYSRLERTLSKIARYLPFTVFRWYGKHLSKQFAKGPELTKVGLSAEDWQCLQRADDTEELTRHYEEAVRPHQGFGVAKDLQLLSTKWGFDIAEVGQVLKHAKVHIWQGDRDKLVPLRMQECVQKQIPDSVVLHKLPGEGHMSWVFYNDDAHRMTLSTLFGGGETSVIENMESSNSGGSL